MTDPKRVKLASQRKASRKYAADHKRSLRQVLDLADHKKTIRQVRQEDNGRHATDTITALRRQIKTSPFSKHHGGENWAMSARLPAAARMWALDQGLSQSNPSRFTDYDADRPDLQSIGGLRRLAGDTDEDVRKCTGYQNPPATVRRSGIVLWGDGGPHPMIASGTTITPDLKKSLKKCKDGEEYYSGSTSVYISTARRAAVTTPHAHGDRVVLGLEFGTGDLINHLRESGAWQYLMEKYTVFVL